jgi:DNA-binding transcriptional LysR family regulator
MNVQMALQSTLPNLLTFCAAFELASFSKAARRLGVTPQAASRSVVRLEETLGVALFRRTTRSITPTDAARSYYQTAREALDLLVRAEMDITRHDATRAGVVRLSAPTTFGHYRLLPSLAGFRERYPGIELEIHVGNRTVDFAVEGYDLAIRLGRIDVKGLVARKLGDFALGVYGSPAYVARHGTPQHPAQLVDHACIAFIMPRTGRLLPWSFAPEPRSWSPHAPIRCAEDVLATITLARAGVGFVQTYDFLVEQDLERGLLVEVLSNYRGASRPFSLVYPQTPKRSPAARVLIDYLLGLPTRTRY